MIPVALTIAGSDPSGGAGLQADLKTFHQHGVYGASVVTLLTVQNTQTVSAIKILDSDFVVAQLDAVLDDIPPLAAKTGALGNAANIEAVAQRAATFSFPLVVDPVMISKHGQPLIEDDAVEVLVGKLLPATFLVTPNLFEASKLASIQVTDLRTMEKAALIIAESGVKHVLVKGGHFDGNAVDVLLSNGEMHRFCAERIETRHTHGTGCVLSAAITARLAGGADVVMAVTEAKRFITDAIGTSPGLGSGSGPVNMHAFSGQRSAVVLARSLCTRFPGRDRVIYTQHPDKKTGTQSMGSDKTNTSEQPSPDLGSIQKSSFVCKAGNLWREGTEAKFLDSIRDGSLPPEAFQRWLVQDYLFAKGLTAFQAIAVSRAPRSAQNVLIAGLATMDAELEWFEQTARELSLDLSAAHHPTCQRYVDYLIASAYTKPVEVLLAILFGVEVAYLCGWSALDATGPYAEFIARWSNEHFLAYVHQIHEVCVSHPHESQQSQFNEVLRHEREFWKMTYEG